MNKNVTININICPDWIDALATPIAATISDTISDLLRILTTKVSFWKKKSEIKTDIKLQNYLNSLKNEINNIGPENLREPQTSIAFPAMETSVFFYEEEHYRMMFSKLIGRSFDSSYDDAIHPSFAPMIQQLSPLDAQILFFLSGSRTKLHRIKIKEIGVRTIPCNVDLLSRSFDDLDASLNNLKRLGLISFIDNNLKANGKNIVEIKDSEYYKEFKKSIDGKNLEDEFLVSLSFTSFGKKFIKVCIN